MDSAVVKNIALESGFDLVGIAPAEPIPEARDAFFAWLKNNYEGDMEWLRKDPRRRTDPREVLPGARSVICLAVNYYPGEHSAQPPTDDTRQTIGKIARYAWGRDYHRVLEKKLKKFVSALEEKFPDHTHRYYVDYGPLLERAYAARAGLGYIGKNACLITMQYGSWVFLSVVVSTLVLTPDTPETRIRCGTCTRCMTACPTAAIIKERIIDARKCISYQTIEKRGKPVDIAVLTAANQPTTTNQKPKTKNHQPKNLPWAFGCDTCQEVCPHNIRAKLTTHPEFNAAVGAGAYISMEQLSTLTSEAEFQEKFAGTAVRRATLQGLRNTMAVIKSHD